MNRSAIPFLQLTLFSVVRSQSIITFNPIGPLFRRRFQSLKQKLDAQDALNGCKPCQRATVNARDSEFEPN